MSVRSCLLPSLVLAAGCNTSAQGPVPVVPREGEPGTGPKVSIVGNGADGRGGICRLREMSATFDTPMDPASIDERRFVLTDEGVPVAGRVSLDSTGRTARFVPAEGNGFAPSRTVVASVLAGADGVRSRTGQPMAEDRLWVFTTGWHFCDGRGLMVPASPSESTSTTERTR